MEVVIGDREVVKRAESATEAARLRREADLLDVATHPGLVEPLGFDDGPRPVLRTAYVGAALSDIDALEVEEVAGVAAAVATTLADLHGIGLVHGAVSPSHVLLDDDGRPVLCGLGYGGLAGERPPSVAVLSPACTDPERNEESPLEPELDVFGLGAIVAGVLESGTGRGGAAEELRRISALATSCPPSSRPTARQLADMVHDSVPAARLPRRGDAVVPPPPRPDRLATRRRRGPLERWRQEQAPGGAAPAWGRRRGLVLVAVALAVAGAAAVVLFPGSARPPGTPEASLVPEPPADPITTVEGPTTTLAVVPGPSPRPAREGCPAVDGAMTADVDGDGCAEAVRYAAGVVEAAGRRWAVGEDGDIAAVGDWSCSGHRSLALLRPRTGEVFAFNGWAAAGRDVSAPLTATVAGGRGLRAADLDGDGCNELVVKRASGAPAVVRPRVGAP
jgi:hypothetical protein